MLEYALVLFFLLCIVAVVLVFSLAIFLADATYGVMSRVVDHLIQKNNKKRLKRLKSL